MPLGRQEKYSQSKYTALAASWLACIRASDTCIDTTGSGLGAAPVMIRPICLLSVIDLASAQAANPRQAKAVGN
jgi:hypothetical protein